MAFIRYCALPQGELTVEEFRAWLAQFDADRDGWISREELQHALRSINVWFALWKARDGVCATNTNRDGGVQGDDKVARLFAFAQRHLHVKITQLGYY
jgi:Ca2+-binding EF-hand superfamily protein